MVKQKDVKKEQNQMKSYNRNIIWNKILNVLLSGDIIAVMAFMDKNPGVAKKLIFGGVVLGVASVGSVINSLKYSDKIKEKMSKERF